jgi:18S rRNA (adenine1779-N6/adenine1780-N6)-dimethyltransferase
MVAELNKRFHNEINSRRLEIIHGDFLAQDLPFFDICVSNVPYQISSPLVFKLLAHRPLFRCAVIMFQKEFALRLVAKPGSDLYCRLSVNVQFLARVDHLMKVSKHNFKPPPKVESSIVRIEPRNPPPEINFVEWDGLLRICFLKKNKTLGSIFKQKTILNMLLNNYETFQNMAQEERKENDNTFGTAFFGKQAESMMDEDNVGDQNKNENENDDEKIEEEKDSKVKVFKEKIVNVLKDGGYLEKRGIKMDLDDFLKLLYLYNKNGIHFR